MNAPDFSRFIVYADESGDHGTVSAEFPIFVLAFCMFEKRRYAEVVTTALSKFKFDHFGHDVVVLHERDIRKRLGPFALLQHPGRREHFMEDMNAIVRDAPFDVVAAVIDKGKGRDGSAEQDNPYHLALRSGLERIARCRSSVGDTGLLHVVFEGRGKKEDADLELEFRRICDSGRLAPPGTMEPLFVPKSANHCGLQLADLVARPVGVHVLRPDQPNRAYDVIEPKLYRASDGQVDGWGLVRLP